MPGVANGLRTKVRSVAVSVVASAAIAAAASAVPTFAQGRMIVLSPTAVQQGQPVHVTASACTGATTVLVDGKTFPAAANGNVFDLTTASLSPGSHTVAVDCGGTASEPAPLTIVAAKQLATPTVVCARNASPRDGAAIALTSTARTAETAAIEAAKVKAKADNVPYPAPEESSRLLARCEKDWAWTLRLEDSLSLQVADFSDWRDADANRQVPLHLFIDGIELANMTIRRVSVDKATKTDSLETILTFSTDASAPEDRVATRTALAQVLRTARSKQWKFGASDMTVSIGPAGGPQWPSTAKIRINPYPTALTWFGAFAAVALIVVIVVLAVRTPLLRDGGGTNAPFSLAKNQMALWFVVIFGSFVFVTVTTGQAAAMSTTALTLIGISGATGLAAIAIDTRKRSVETSEKQALEAERTTLQQELDGPGGLREKRKAAADSSAEAAQLDATIQAKLQRLEVVTAKLQSAPAPQAQTSKGWLTDILSDEHGLSFHRLQMAAWTLAMVGVFIVAVWRTFAMAEFDATMLALLGISSGTYLGFKFPERDTTSDGSNR
jgi:hypothetical protein